MESYADLKKKYSDIIFFGDDPLATFVSNEAEFNRLVALGNGQFFGLSANRQITMDDLMKMYAGVKPRGVKAVRLS